MCAPCCNILRCHSAISTPSTSILSDCCHHLRVFCTSPSWTDSRGGQKPSFSQTPQPSLVPRCCCFIGLHILAFYTDISLDRGAQFTSQLWTVMIELLGAKLHRMMAYHLQANGLVEHFHRHLKVTLKARLEDVNWLDVLPWVLLGIHTAPKETRLWCTTHSARRFRHCAPCTCEYCATPATTV